MKLIFVLALVFGLGVTQLGCLPGPGPGPVGPGPVVIGAVVDCTMQSRDQVTSLVSEFQTLLIGKMPDWAAIYQRAKNAGKAIGGCALAEIVQSYLGNRAAPPPQADSWTAYSTLERFRREEAGNATFKTSAGDL